MTELRNKISLVFIGQKNFYTEFLVDWLGELTALKGVIWTASDRHSKGYDFRRLRKRIKRFGFFQVLSEVLYYIGNRKYKQRDEQALIQLIEQAKKEHLTNVKKAPEIEVPNLRGDNVSNFIKKFDCDIILTQCINEIIPESIFTIPKIGCFVYHEGSVPKYRGKFCTHWAILNGEYDQIGASLIKVARGLDTGKIAFVEHVIPEGTGHRHQWWEHEVLWLALPKLKKWIEDVAAGQVDLTEQKSYYPIYSYPRFSHLFKIGKCVRNYERRLKEKSLGGDGLSNTTK